LGPDEPFKGFNADGTLSDGSGSGAIDPADPASTGVVMRLRVVAATGSDTSTPPDQLTLPSFADLVPGGHTRQLSLHEEVYEPADIPVAARLGTDGEPKHWGDPVTENPVLNSTEEWHIDNQTEDAHPIHIHLVQFQVVGRDSRPPEPWEDGFKDTVIAYPGEITKLKARFDRAGLYVWHCHIVEHEDNEMMRPYRVGP
jgi:bilirubin oxidase